MDTGAVEKNTEKIKFQIQLKAMNKLCQIKAKANRKYKLGNSELKHTIL